MCGGGVGGGGGEGRHLFSDKTVKQQLSGEK